MGVKALVVTRLGDPTKPPGTAHSPWSVELRPRQPLVDPRGVRLSISAGAINFADGAAAGWGRAGCSRGAAVGNCVTHYSPPHAPCAALQVQGLYQEKPKTPFVAGNECSGVVVEVGRDVRTVSVGDKARAGRGGGGGLRA